MQRFQADAHEVLKLLNDRLSDMRSDENFQAVRNLFDRSHDMVDLTVDLVNSSAEVANQLIANLRAKHRPRDGKSSGTRMFNKVLADYRSLTQVDLLRSIPRNGPPHLYELVFAYPGRRGKGLRAALCFATCAALGGSRQQALNSAVAIELLHNAFLVHDDMQDGS